ncbi:MULTISPECIES: DUF5592 family protein [Vagococcus]|uniref:DUF5592 family protein n=1 Tax=Vagococcus TaxID=2737 RepID=UPI000B35DDF1|nr:MULTISPECIES: DUF5592 family protein [Vagococcus]HCM90573.1 hypothetical protein [Vagococcus sp.]
MYRNPKNIKQEIKLFFFYLLDLGIISACVMFSVYFAKLLPISPYMKLLFYGLSGVVGLWLCVRTPAHPKERNLQIVFHMFSRDKNKYHDVEFKRTKRGKIEL